MFHRGMQKKKKVPLKWLKGKQLKSLILGELTWAKLSVMVLLSDRRRATMTEGLRSDGAAGRSPWPGRPWAQPPWGSVWPLCTGTDTGMTRGTIAACLLKAPSSCWGTIRKEAGRLEKAEESWGSSRKIKEKGLRYKKRKKSKWLYELFLHSASIFFKKKRIRIIVSEQKYLFFLCFL